MGHPLPGVPLAFVFAFFLRCLCVCVCVCVVDRIITKRGWGSAGASDGRPSCCLHMCACDGRVGEAESANRGSSVVGTVSVSVGSVHAKRRPRCEAQAKHWRSVSRRVTPTATCGLRLRRWLWLSSESKTKKKKKTKNRAPPRDASQKKSRNQISKNNSKKKNRFGASSAAFRLSANA